MGRAIVREPEVFLFDEPLSNLDAALRVQVRTEIKRLHQTLRTTTVYVTHDQVEAMTLADRVVVMNGGNIEQVGAPQELDHSPKTRFVAGSPSMNFMSVRLVAGEEGQLKLELRDRTKLPVPPSRTERYGPSLNRELALGLRPEHLTDRANTNAAARIDPRIDMVEPLGLDTLVYFNIGGTMVCARIDPNRRRDA
jgi:multiple sugar transport system ATP-binding protein